VTTPSVTRHQFGDTLADWTFRFAGDTVTRGAGATVTFWSALTGGSQYTDLLNAAGGGTSSVTTDANGQIPPFSGPAGITRMAADANSGNGPRAWIMCTDLADVAVQALPPSGDTTGATDTANVQATLNTATAGTEVLMAPGHWYWNTTITIPAGVWLVMAQGYRAAGSKISMTAGFTGTSAVAFAPATPCGGVRGLVLDGSALPAGAVDGIACTGACKFGSIIGCNIGHFTGHGISITVSGGNPDGWHLREISCHDNAGSGVWWDYAVDGQMDTFHLDHNNVGLSLGTMNNITFSHGKCQQNTLYGYGLTGGFVKSNATFTACLSENNGQDGWHMNVTTGGGQGALSLMGCSTRDDGTSGTSGSGYSGFWLNSKNVDLTLTGCSNYVTASAAGPDYGLTLAGCLGNTAILGGTYGGAVAAYHDGGGNTGALHWAQVTQWTGQAGSRSGVTVVNT
jgi:hypothetical protein